jgi:DNA-binding IscR family transcriptional regulator
MAASRCRRFLRALFDMIGANPLRWTSIDSVADRSGIDHEEAGALAAELEAADLVRIGGGHGVTLTEAGQLVVKERARLSRAPFPY